MATLWRRAAGRTYHEDEVKYEEQVLDHAHSAPHLGYRYSRFVAAAGERERENWRKSLDARGSHKRRRTLLRDRRLGFNWPPPTEIPIQATIRARGGASGARVRPKLAELDWYAWRASHRAARIRGGAGALRFILTSSRDIYLFFRSKRELLSRNDIIRLSRVVRATERSSGERTDSTVSIGDRTGRRISFHRQKIARSKISNRITI